MRAVMVGGFYYEKRRVVQMANNSELTAKINIEAEEAIKGLKAIQREAKEATKALRDLECTTKGYRRMEEFFVKEGGNAQLDVINKTDKSTSYGVHVPAKIVVYYE